MRNLFLRFFLSFWTATVLVVAGSVAASLWLAAERLDHERDQQESLAREANEVLVAGGEPAMREWLDRRSRELFPDRLYLLDSNGVDLAGHRVPDFLQAAAGHGPFPRPEPGDGRPRRNEFRLLSQLVDPRTHKSWAFSLQHPRNGGTMMFGVFATPATPFIFGLVSLLVSAAICYLLARQLSRPIQHLRDATRSIADGDLGVQVAGLLGKRRDELALLAHDFDAMATRLRNLLDSQQQLLRDVSHELRSPLARMQIALELARRPQANLPQELDRIEQDAQRLDELIGEILSLSRLEEATRSLEAVRVPLEDVLEPLIEDAQVEAGPRQVQVRLQAAPGLAVQGDRELLHRAVENVVRNALRFSPEGGEVLVEARADGAGVAIVVSDSGPGVPPEHLQKIFDPFHRVASARDRDSGGYGIGLAITSRVVRLHGGTVSASNRAPSGLRVEMLLPRPRAG